MGRRAVLAAAALSLPAWLARRTRALPAPSSVTVARVLFDPALRHNIADLWVYVDGVAYAASLLTYYHASGGLWRWGHAVSEPLIENGLLVQYFQRGVMEWSGDGTAPMPRAVWDFIGGGLEGSPDLGAEPGTSNPFGGTAVGPFGHVVSNQSVDGDDIGFLDAFHALGGAAGLGFPKTEARRDTGAPGTVIDPTAEPDVIRQYFQAGVLEFAAGHAEPVRLRLSGDAVRNRAYPAGLWTLIHSFRPAHPLRVGDRIDLEALERRIGAVVAGAPRPPTGFSLAAVLSTADLGLPVALAFGPDDRLYISMSNNAILTHAGVPGAEAPVAFAQGLDPLGVDEPRGVAFIGDAAYASVRKKIIRLRDTSGSGAADESVEIVTGLPERADLLHRNNGIVAGPDGLLYVAVGSTSNMGEEPETELSGTILRVAPDGSRVDVVARGFRNPFDLAFAPNGELFCTDNAPDVPVRAADDAPDELNHVIEGRDYGHPTVWGEPPEGSTTQGPAAALPAHAAATGITFFTGPQAGAFAGDALVATWGPGLGRSSYTHNVLRVRLERRGETYAGEVHPFVTGLDRPTDVVIAPDGDVVISDHVGRVIYRVTRR
ncbi:MAG: PQQ-dependent sugar dehydrogenase [Chloroflexi bacterium]|nr:PQQ-dependent sugar dehydrogenase [Chloroflexota bacterium]